MSVFDLCFFQERLEERMESPPPGVSAGLFGICRTVVSWKDKPLTWHSYFTSTGFVFQLKPGPLHVCCGMVSGFNCGISVLNCGIFFSSRLCSVLVFRCLGHPPGMVSTWIHLERLPFGSVHCLSQGFCKHSP